MLQPAYLTPLYLRRFVLGINANPEDFRLVMLTSSEKTWPLFPEMAETHRPTPLQDGNTLFLRLKIYMRLDHKPFPSLNALQINEPTKLFNCPSFESQSPRNPSSSLPTSTPPRDALLLNVGAQDLREPYYQEVRTDIGMQTAKLKAESQGRKAKVRPHSTAGATSGRITFSRRHCWLGGN
jgi:hypothetical protein